MDNYTVENIDECLQYFKNGELHNDGYAAAIHKNGTLEYWNNGKLHREKDLPAIEMDGDRYWMVDGKFHRIGKPAVMFANGSIQFWEYGELHRLRGPAIISKGDKEWHIRGKKLEEWVPKIENCMSNKELSYNIIIKVILTINKEYGMLLLKIFERYNKSL